jgi:hypothetical protein
MLEDTRICLLQAEIDFWKEMVRIRRGRQDPKTSDYLKLQKQAEHRLFDLAQLARAA